jgi:hypothetical protein
MPQRGHESLGSIFDVQTGGMLKPSEWIASNTAMVTPSQPSSHRRSRAGACLASMKQLMITVASFHVDLVCAGRAAPD